MTDDDEQFPPMSGDGPGDYTRTRKPKPGARHLSKKEVAECDAHNQKPHGERARLE